MIMLRKILNKIKGHFVVHVRDVKLPYLLEIKEKDRFKNQVAIVTGGSGVIGRAISYRLAAEGAEVYICGTNKDRVNAVVSEIVNDGYKAKPLIFSVKNEDEVIAAFSSVIKDSGKIDLLVCSAGGGAREKSSPLIEQSMNVIDSVLDINLRGGILCTKEACRYMVKQKYGKILIISSTVGVCGMPSYSEYAAAKGGLIAFVKSIAMEHGSQGIRINCITPGIVQRGTIDDRQLEWIKKTNWCGGYGKPEDISGMVAYLNSKEADFITGQNFIVDGGRSLGLKNN